MQRGGGTEYAIECYTAHSTRANRFLSNFSFFWWCIYAIYICMQCACQKNAAHMIQLCVFLRVLLFLLLPLLLLLLECVCS